MDAVAVTDHGNMHAAVHFYEQAKARKGHQADPGRRGVRRAGRPARPDVHGRADGGYHLVLLAENETGWDNLL
jgi:DNA polymerase-3 subunit alpha